MAQTQLQIPVNQAPSKSNGGGVPDQPTLDNYLRQRVNINNQLGYVQQGQLWVGGNPTPGTGIASHAAPTATDGTKPVCMMMNNYAVGTDKHIYVQSILLAVTVAGANATSSRIYVEKSAQGVTRFTSGGSTNLNATTLVANACGSASYATSAVLRLGAVGANADTAAKLIGKGLVRSIIPKVNDQIIVDFGDATGQSGCTLLDYANTGAAVTRFRMPMVDLGPGEQLLVHLVNAAQDAASSYELTATWIEG